MTHYLDIIIDLFSKFFTEMLIPNGFQISVDTHGLINWIYKSHPKQEKV